jgi:hypothetical protein
MFQDAEQSTARHKRIRPIHRHAETMTRASSDPVNVHRRAFLSDAAAGIGITALATLWNPNILQADPVKPGMQGNRGVISPLHFPQRIKRVIFLYMSGGPSQLETFDEKPQLASMSGQAMPDSFTAGQPIAQLQDQKLFCLAPQFKFKSWGQSGQRMTELFPQIGAMADRICIIRSMHTDQINHDPAHTVMNTGTSISGRPSMGSWIQYGIGSESADLPGFIVLTSHQGGRSPQPISTRMWHSGFLEPKYQGVHFQSTGDAVHYLTRPPGVSDHQQRDVVSAVQEINRLQQLSSADPEIGARISQYELAFRMQMSVPQLMDFSDEPQHVLDLYGAKGADGTFATNCLLARRLAERGVRFIQLYHRDWDHHNGLVDFMKLCAGICDRPSAALIRDLQQRGMLDETLLIWGGEFGRTPMAQTNKGAAGRDHHIRAFSMWMAGGGVKGGVTYGSTDELGYHVATDPVHVHDLHATMLYLLGIDHKRLVVRAQGRDFRLTDVSGRVLHELLT